MFYASHDKVENYFGSDEHVLRELMRVYNNEVPTDAIWNQTHMDHSLFYVAEDGDLNMFADPDLVNWDRGYLKEMAKTYGKEYLIDLMERFREFLTGSIKVSFDGELLDGQCEVV